MSTYDKEEFPFMFGKDPVSELQVMQSAAGYYIGRAYWDTEYGFPGPYSRDSGYYPTREMAQAALNHMEHLS